MEAQPSPQIVGREFVRQYYTLLNKAPDHLHRFYNNSSSFLHEGLDANNRDAQMVIGQKQIHNKILQLNFRDCHAKISHVDAQATLGNGVVVQATGELSNAGQPMRRFTQTFVLASQSPKKYYVHNDIFRYQDYYVEDEVEENGRSDVEDVDASVAESLENVVTVPAVVAQAPIYYQSTTNVYQPPPVNGLHSMEDQQHVAPPSVQSLPPPPATMMEAISSAANDDEPKLDTGDDKDSMMLMDASPMEAYDDSDMPAIPNNEPKTYANLVKSGGGGVGGPPQTMSFVVQPVSPPPSKFPSQVDRFEAPNPTQKPLAQRPMRGKRRAIRLGQTRTQNNFFLFFLFLFSFLNLYF